MKHFTEKEFRCKCCGQLPPSVRENITSLVDNVLDPVRDQLGETIYVTSGYRCPKHNAEVGGVPNSQHMRGEAADIHASTSSATDKLARLIVAQGKFDQLILYPTFLHVSYKRVGTNRHRILRKVANGYSIVNNLNQ